MPALLVCSVLYAFLQKVQRKSTSTNAVHKIMRKLTQGFHQEIGYLLQLGEGVNAKKNKTMNTVLHFAASKGSLETVKLLTENGAQVCLVPYEHFTK